MIKSQRTCLNRRKNNLVCQIITTKPEIFAHPAAYIVNAFT